MMVTGGLGWGALVTGGYGASGADIVRQGFCSVADLAKSINRNRLTTFADDDRDGVPSGAVLRFYIFTWALVMQGYLHDRYGDVATMSPIDYDPGDHPPLETMNADLSSFDMQYRNPDGDVDIDAHWVLEFCRDARAGLEDVE